MSDNPFDLGDTNSIDLNTDSTYPEHSNAASTNPDTNNTEPADTANSYTFHAEQTGAEEDLPLQDAAAGRNDSPLQNEAAGRNDLPLQNEATGRNDSPLQNEAAGRNESNYHSQQATTVQKKPRRKKCWFARFLFYVSKAALFGIIAAATFLGFQHVFYYYHPELTTSNGALHSYVNSKLDVGTTDPDLKLSATTVSDGVKMNTADVSDLVEKTMTATVSISSTYNSSYYIWGQEYQNESEGGGSGIIIKESEDELLIATNNHVVANTTKLIITFIDGSTAEGVIKGHNAQSDLAVVSVDLTTISDETRAAISVAKLGNSDSVKVGQMVVAIGNALGYGQSVTVGYISAKDREITLSDNLTMSVLQTDAAINPGNSGGALINVQGEVVGINSAKIGNTSVEGIGYAIPIDHAIPIVDELMQREVLTEKEKGYLGVYIENVTDEIAKAYNWPKGIYVYDLVENGSAMLAGILKGDIITAVNGVKMTTAAELKEFVTSYRVGTTIRVTLSRIENGTYQEKTIEVTLQSAPETTAPSNPQDTVPTPAPNELPNPSAPEIERPENPSPENDAPGIDEFFWGDGNDSLQDFFDRLFP